MNGQKKIDTVHELFKLMYLVMDYERVKRTYGADVEINSAEIYLIKCIAENPGCNVTSLAGMLDVSKAAVSQLLKRIKKKGMIIIHRDANNSSRYIIHLTDKGNLAHDGHMKLKADLYADLIQSLDMYADESIHSIYQFLVVANSVINKRI